MGRGRFKKPKPLSIKPVVDLPVLGPALDEFVKYLAAQYNRSTVFLHNAAFGELVAAIDASYRVFGNGVPGVNKMGAHFLIVCHQAFYSAVSCTARGTPMDAAASSRRALEAARTALAISLDPRNLQKWLAFQDRLARWQARQTDERPRKLDIRYDVVEADPLAKKLGLYVGILSDGAVHFTPEFLSGVTVQERRRGTQLWSEYLEDEEAVLARELRTLAAVHLLILKTFGRCFGDGASDLIPFRNSLEHIQDAAQVLYKRYPIDLPANIEVESGE